LTARPGDLEWLAMQARAANALRELGRFEESMTLLRTLQREAVTAPSANDRDAGSRRGWGKYLEGLEKAVAERNPASEPWAMLSEDQRISECVDMNPAERGASIDGFCSNPKVAARVQEIVTNRARACLEMAKDSPKVWSDSFCANPEVAERAKALPPQPTED